MNVAVLISTRDEKDKQSAVAKVRQNIRRA